MSQVRMLTGEIKECEILDGSKEELGAISEDGEEIVVIYSSLKGDDQHMYHQV